MEIGAGVISPVSWFAGFCRSAIRQSRTYGVSYLCHPALKKKAPAYLDTTQQITAIALRRALSPRMPPTMFVTSSRAGRDALLAVRDCEKELDRMSVRLTMSCQGITEVSEDEARLCLRASASPSTLSASAT